MASSAQTVYEIILPSEYFLFTSKPAEVFYSTNYPLYVSVGDSGSKAPEFLANDSDTVWKITLPSEYSIVGDKIVFSTKESLNVYVIDTPVLYSESTRCFWFDGKSGKKCNTIGAMGLFIDWETDPNFWKKTTDPSSRFPDVLELISVYNLEIKGNIAINMLSNNTKYAAYFVYKVKNSSENLNAVNVTLTLDNQKVEGQVDLYKGIDRTDGWKEVKLGEFQTSDGTTAGEVNVTLLDSRLIDKRGMIVEGIEFRPN